MRTLQLLLPRRQHGEELVAGGEAVLRDRGSRNMVYII